MSEVFRQVGEFPEPVTIPRSRLNKYDKSSIVSIFPVDIEETKHTIQPSLFKIPAGSIEHPSVLVVGPSSWWVHSDKHPPIEVPCSSPEIALSIVFDYCSGMLACDMENTIPGIFFIPGQAVTPEDVKKNYGSALATAKLKQDNWYRELVAIADSLWARSNGNPRVIWDIMRLAAKSLNLIDKPWIADMMAVSLTKCFACGKLKDPEYPICPHCRTIDPSHPRAKEIKVAG